MNQPRASHYDFLKLSFPTSSYVIFFNICGHHRHSDHNDGCSNPKLRALSTYQVNSTGLLHKCAALLTEAIPSAGSALIDTLDEFVNLGKIEPQIAFKVLLLFDEIVPKVMAEKVKARMHFKVSVLRPQNEVHAD